jgi:hypothetical protein
MATNRRKTEASKKRAKYGRNYPKEVRQQGNATPGGKSAQLKKRADDNKKRTQRKLKGNTEVSRGVGNEDGNKNAKRQPKRKGKRTRRA